MHRFYLPPAQCQGSVLTLEGREAHHGLNVLRIGPGEQVSVLDGMGHQFQCDVSRKTKRELRLTVVGKEFTSRPPWQITLLQALPRGKIFESIIQKATELGVARIVPLLSARTVTQLDNESAPGKVEKWRLTAIEAIKQCGSPWLPAVELPVTPGEFLARDEACELPLIAALTGERRHARVWFDGFRKEHGRNPRLVSVWVGPEGDFTPDEGAAVRTAGARAISLGDLVLRVETAAVCCLSTLSYELRATES